MVLSNSLSLRGSGLSLSLSGGLELACNWAWLLLYRDKINTLQSDSPAYNNNIKQELILGGWRLVARYCADHEEEEKRKSKKIAVMVELKIG